MEELVAKGLVKAIGISKLLHHKDRATAPDGQDRASCEPSGVSSLPPAAKTEGVPGQ